MRSSVDRFPVEVRSRLHAVSVSRRRSLAACVPRRRLAQVHGLGSGEVVAKGGWEPRLASSPPSAVASSYRRFARSFPWTRC